MRNLSILSLILLSLVVWLVLPFVASADYLGGITCSPASPSHLDHNTWVDITIDYKIDDPAGGRVFARPFSFGAPTPSYSASPAPLLPMGTGTTTQSFLITSGEHIVTHIRVYLVSPDQSETWLEMFLPVYYHYGPHGVFNIQMDHNPFDRLPHGRQLNIDFDYTTEAAGCLIYARPFTNGSLTPGYLASGSANLPPSGSYSQDFLFNADADVTDIRFQMFALDNTTLLYEFFVPFDIHWRQWGVYHISFDWPAGESLHNDQHLTSAFTFEHNDPAGLYVWIWSMTDGGYTPGSAYQASALLPAGINPVTRYTTVYEGEQVVDHIRFIVGLPDEAYLMFDVPRVNHWGPHAVQNHWFNPRSPAIMSHGEHLDMAFEYVTSHPEGVRIYARPAYNYEPLFGMTSDGSPLYSPPAGTGDFWCTYTSGFTQANSIRFQMVNDDQTVLLLEHFVSGLWAWGTSATPTAAPEPIPAMAVNLGPSYPNPFNPTATIPVTLSREAAVMLAVYDLRGRLVRTLAEGVLPAGDHTFTFNGEGLASGGYICRLESPLGVQSQHMVLVK